MTEGDLRCPCDPLNHEPFSHGFWVNFLDALDELVETTLQATHELFQDPTAMFPPDLSSTRIESDFCSSIVTVQRISPLRLFKIRQHRGLIILSCL